MDSGYSNEKLETKITNKLEEIDSFLRPAYKEMDIQLKHLNQRLDALALVHKKQTITKKLVYDLFWTYFNFIIAVDYTSGEKRDRLITFLRQYENSISDFLKRIDISEESPSIQLEEEAKFIAQLLDIKRAIKDASELNIQLVSYLFHILRSSLWKTHYVNPPYQSYIFLVHHNKEFKLFDKIFTFYYDDMFH